MRGKVIGALVIGLILLSACSKGKTQMVANKGKGVEILTVSVEKPKKEDIELVIDATGTFYSFEEATVSFEVDGKILEISKDLGDYVKKGEILARISPEEYVLKKEQSEADLKNAESELKRISELYEKKFATEQQLDIAKRNVNVAKAQFDLMLKKLKDCDLRSPISGFISKRIVNAGEYARTGSQAFYIVNTAILKFRLEVSEKYSGYVKVKDRVTIRTESAQEVEGIVYRISPSVNLESRAFIVEVKVENKNGLIKPGSFGLAKIFVSHKYPALTISENSVSYFSGTPRVFKIQDSKAIEQIIKIKERVGRRLVVESGLSEDDLIANSLVDTLTNNQIVKIKE